MFVLRENIPSSTLIFNTGVPSATGISAPPLTDPNPIVSTDDLPPPNPPVTTHSSTPTDATSSASPNSSQPGSTVATPPSTINLGTVIGACTGSFLLLILLILLVVWHSRRNRKASLQLRDGRTKRDNWNKLADNPRDSRRSSFESKPSLPHTSLDYISDYPPTIPRVLPSQLPYTQTETPHYTIPAHPYSSSHSMLQSGEAESRNPPNGNPFADPDHTSKKRETDATSLYSTSSNPFESVYSPPTGNASRINASEGFSGSPFFTPHPDSSVQGEKWGSVGKERNVQQSYASSDAETADKLGSLIAALDLGGSGENEEKADRSMHGHLGRVADD